MASPTDDQPDREDSSATKELLHKTKLIQFLGRNTPIILQNDNGPCPLLAICNVLLLRNNLKLSSDVAEVSQEKLLSLVAERLIDSNSNVNNKDAGYVENQQQNIADAIDLLPRLTTGIDVNLKFTRIDDFEFTRECAIFDLLDIPLYHGWIVDPQDSETYNAIGLKSYNTLMGELVALEIENPESESKNSKEEEEDCVDFVAATTASLGVPSPSLSHVKSFNDSPNSVSEVKTERKGDLQEEEQLLRALKLSETEKIDVNIVNTDDNNLSAKPKDSGEEHTKSDELITSKADSMQDVGTSSEGDNAKLHEGVEPQSEKYDNKNENEKTNSGDEKIQQDQSVSGNDVNVRGVVESVVDESEPIYEGEEHVQETSTANYENREPVYEGEVVLAEQVDKVSSSADENKGNENQEPVYEGEVVLAEKVDKVSSNADEKKGNDKITPKQGELIRNFLNNSANQLTIYGLFSLQEGLKERELCVFFRNNHFNTMFKFEGELYLLATDQGYINQPGLVWEKLNEVNGNTVYMTGNFKEFNAENPETHSWDDLSALTNTAEYIASIDNAAQENTSFNSDLQLAIALQQQEFEQQEQPPQRNLPQTSTSAESGLVTGPQHVQPSRPRNSSKQESKSSKDKCVVM